MIFRDDALKGKTAFITGSTSGIGLSTAKLFSAVGARVVLCGRDQDKLQSASSELSGDGHESWTADVSTLDMAHDAVFAASKAFGPFDILFHSAGASGLRAAKLINQGHVDHVFGAALYGALGLAKASAKRGVIVDGGAITLMSSAAAVRGRSGMLSYSASRAAISGLCRTLASELAPRKIRVNEIIAGGVVTPMHEDISSVIGDGGVESYKALHLLGFGSPEDIASTAVFLGSDAGSWITGASIAVDGGYTSF